MILGHDPTCVTGAGGALRQAARRDLEHRVPGPPAATESVTVLLRLDRHFRRPEAATVQSDAPQARAMAGSVLERRVCT